MGALALLLICQSVKKLGECCCCNAMLLIRFRYKRMLAKFLAVATGIQHRVQSQWHGL